MKPISVRFLCAAIKSLAHQHGDRIATPQLDPVIDHLSQAEALFVTLPLVPKKKKRKSPARRAAP